MKQLGHIRKSFHVPHKSTTPEPELIQALPRARRPIVDPNVSPPANRIARPPTVPGIFEDEEEEDAHNDNYLPSPPRRKSKTRPSSSGSSSGSRLPLPSRAASPPTDDPLDFEEQLSKAGKKKPTRRQSGLLTTTMAITTVTPKGYKTELISQRPPSPAFGSPLRRDAGLDEEEDEVMAVIGVAVPDDDEEEEEPIALSVTRRDRKKKTREKDDEVDMIDPGKKDREKRRARDLDGAPGPSSYEGRKPKLKDVTNSPPPRPSLATIDLAHGKCIFWSASVFIDRTMQIANDNELHLTIYPQAHHSTLHALSSRHPFLNQPRVPICPLLELRVQHRPQNPTPNFQRQQSHRLEAEKDASVRVSTTLNLNSTRA